MSSESVPNTLQRYRLMLGPQKSTRFCYLRLGLSQSSDAGNLHLAFVVGWALIGKSVLDGTKGRARLTKSET